MADDMEFDSFDNMDDLDWSDLENKVADTPEGESGDTALPSGMGDASAPAADANTAMLSASSEIVDINYLLDVNLQVMVEVGQRMINISNVLAYGHGSIIELDKLVGAPLNLMVNAKPVAKGEVVVVNEKFALKITEILDPKDRLAYLHQ